MCNYLESWKLPDLNFYPHCMLKVPGESPQSAVIVVSGSCSLFSLIVSDFNEAVRAPSLFTKCSLENSDHIVTLECLESTVVVATTGGELMLYDPVDNRCTTIDSYSQVKHVGRASVKNQLFVVSQKEGVPTTVLEIVEACGGHPSRLNSLKSYEMIAECIDSGSTYCIKTYTINATNQRFLGDFLGFSKLAEGDEVILIAIYNQLYWLQPRELDECDLVSVRCFASNVLGFDFSEAAICLSVLLEAGVLAVLSQSVNPDTLLVSCSFVYLQAPIEAYVFDSANNALLYSNGLTTHRVWYHFSEEAKQLVSEVDEIPVRGVMAFTLLENRGTVLLLTENSQFYEVTCTVVKSRKPVADTTEMVTLRKELRAEAKRWTKILTDEVEFDKRLEQALEREQADFSVLALHQNMQAFSKLCSMETTFHQQMPARQTNTLFIEAEGNQAPCVFVSVRIVINLGFFELLSKQQRWTVCIEYDEHSVMYPIHETFHMSSGIFHGIVFLSQRQLTHGLPNFRAFFFATVQHGEDSLLLTITVPSSSCEKTNVDNLVKQIDPTTNQSTTRNRDEQTKKKSYDTIVSKNNPFSNTRDVKRQLAYCVQNEQSKTRAVSFSCQLDNHPNDTWFVLEKSVGLSWQGGKDTLVLKCHHPAALDLVKRFLLQDDEFGSETEPRLERLKGTCLELQAVSSAELIVQLYLRTRSNNTYIE